MGLKTRWRLSSDGTSYEQEPANPIPIAPTRLDDLLVAMAVFPSTKRARRAIDEKKVKVGLFDKNGRGEFTEEMCIDHAIVVHPSTISIIIDGEMKPIDSLLCSYILLHKPRGYICSVTPENGAKGVFDLLDSAKSDNDAFGRAICNRAGLFVCGRLDCQSEGLLLMTNDGKLGRKLLDPGRCEKRYEVLITSKTEGGASMDSKILQDTFAKVCREGQYIVEGSKEVLVLPASMNIVERLPKASHHDLQDYVEMDAICTWVEVVLMDGRKRELRRLFGALGYRVLRLARTAFSGISDDELLQLPGDFRHLTFDEISKLQSIK